jgi:hypothetical protein
VFSWAPYVARSASAAASSISALVVTAYASLESGAPLASAETSTFCASAIERLKAPDASKPPPGIIA